MSRFRGAAAWVAFSACTLAAASVSVPGWAMELASPSVTTPALNEAEAGSVPTIRFAAPKAVVQSLEAPVQDVASADEAAGDYASLQDAVAAQSMPDEMAEDLNCLATTVFFESKGEPLAGQLAVAHVVLNRTKSGRFPKGICSVVMQPGQFGFVRGGTLPTVNTGRRDWRTAVAVAKLAIADGWRTLAPQALYFHARRAAPGWGHPRVATIGNHIFYR